MMCSKCWLHGPHCLDYTHALLKAKDTTCRAMRAVMRLARRTSRAEAITGRLDCHFSTCREIGCTECLARWATGVKS